ncbi:MAG TPA: hypothetical protein DDZ88_05845 [Verrucomicrobiales bacterium]|nr:hypothetical protein [Verrucomicrobiales bacterium]
MLHGVVFTQKPGFFWFEHGLCAEFVFGEKMFQIEADPWDGALWISSKHNLAHPKELAAIRHHLEALAFPNAPRKNLSTSV